MQRLLTMFIYVFAALVLSGCGSHITADILAALNPSEAGKTPCPGDHTGFFVCLSSDSSFNDSSVHDAITEGLAKLVTLVNSKTFQDRVATDFSNSGSQIDGAMTATNYIVTITGYCDPNSTTLAQAIVGGETIQYNECRVSKDAAGQPDVASVAGVLLHEISHNVGYTHPPTDPNRVSVPYHLGDIADDELAPAGSPTTNSNGTILRTRPRYDFGD